MVVMHSVELEELMKNGAYHRVALLPHIPPSKFDEDGCKEKCSQRCSSMKWREFVAEIHGLMHRKFWFRRTSQWTTSILCIISRITLLHWIKRNLIILQQRELFFFQWKWTYNMTKKVNIIQNYAFFRVFIFFKTILNQKSDKNFS